MNSYEESRMEDRKLKERRKAFRLEQKKDRRKVLKEAKAGKFKNRKSKKPKNI